jgi:hypothetical protein
MARSPEEQRKTDAERIGEQGTGKLDDTKNKDAVVKQPENPVPEEGGNPAP